MAHHKAISNTVLERLAYWYLHKRNIPMDEAQLTDLAYWMVKPYRRKPEQRCITIGEGYGWKDYPEGEKQNKVVDDFKIHIEKRLSNKKK